MGAVESLTGADDGTVDVTAAEPVEGAVEGLALDPQAPSRSTASPAAAIVERRGRWHGGTRQVCVEAPAPAVTEWRPRAQRRLRSMHDPEAPRGVQQTICAKRRSRAPKRARPVRSCAICTEATARMVADVAIMRFT